ncbi:hypothetical protein BRD00_09965 [Halobacteriales archaeon QS_8_69_26]|nr:MAG: hypothetical protein BRD00_09965 [Halobacteriales archaeon QS_8_69_26]
MNGPATLPAALDRLRGSVAPRTARRGPRGRGRRLPPRVHGGRRGRGPEGRRDERDRRRERGTRARHLRGRPYQRHRPAGERDQPARDVGDRDRRTPVELDEPR